MRQRILRSKTKARKDLLGKKGEAIGIACWPNRGPSASSGVGPPPTTLSGHPATPTCHLPTDHQQTLPVGVEFGNNQNVPTPGSSVPPAVTPAGKEPDPLILGGKQTGEVEPTLTTGC
uniref:Uncharacterized protein n=1 Tax=Anopheles maculatus TaxID=74869 RepID=A0A182SK83_9DIPT